MRNKRSIKTHKIYGGILGSETKYQIDCLYNLIESVYDAFWKYSYKYNKSNILTKKREVLNEIVSQSKKTSHIIDRHWRRKLTTGYEEKRNELIDIFISLITRLNLNLDDDVHDESSLTFLINLLEDIKKNNNKRTTSSKDNYNIFRQNFCNMLNENPDYYSDNFFKLFEKYVKPENIDSAMEIIEKSNHDLKLLLQQSQEAEMENIDSIKETPNTSSWLSYLFPSSKGGSYKNHKKSNKKSNKNKTHKIRGGRFGSETKQQIQCLFMLILAIYRAFWIVYKRHRINKDKDHENERKNEEKIEKLRKQVNESEYKYHTIYKIFGLTSNYEKERNKLIDIFDKLLKDLRIDSFMPYSKIIKVLYSIKDHNNYGKIKHTDDSIPSESNYDFIKKTCQSWDSERHASQFVNLIDRAYQSGWIDLNDTKQDILASMNSLNSKHSHLLSQILEEKENSPSPENPPENSPEKSPKDTSKKSPKDTSKKSPKDTSKKSFWQRFF